MLAQVYSYGILVLILVALALRIQWHLTLPPAYHGDPYGVDALGLTMLFDHLAMAFKWPKRIATALWILALSWMAFAFFYILYLSRVLYPLHT